MNAMTRRQIELAQRVRDFAQAYPSTDAAYSIVVARITSAADRVEELHLEHVQGIGNAKAATSNLTALRLQLRDLIRHVAKAAALAKAGGTSLARDYPMPTATTAIVELGADARSTLDYLADDGPLLREFGLGGATVDELTKALEAFHATRQARTTARNTHVGALSEMKDAMRELRAATELLDSVNVLRFPRTSSELAEWKRLKSLLGAPRTTAAKTDAPTPARDPDVRPAA